MSYKKLGIPLESRDYGKLVLTQWSPETDEIFILRERVLPPNATLRTEALYHAGAEAENMHILSLMRLEKKGEGYVGRATYLPTEKGIYLAHIKTETPHLRRDVASSLLAYIKARGEDIILSMTRKAEPFYRKMGFVDAGKTRVVKLPAGKPLPGRWFEGKARKFLILPRKRGRLKL